MAIVNSTCLLNNADGAKDYETGSKAKEIEMMYVYICISSVCLCNTLS